MSILYTAHATTVGAPTHHTKTDNAVISLDISAPGKKQNATNPEQLFACAYGSCFCFALEEIMRKEEIKGSVTVHTTVHFTKGDDGYAFKLEVDISINGLESEEKLIDLIRKGHRICPMSKATEHSLDKTYKANGKEISVS